MNTIRMTSRHFSELRNHLLADEDEEAAAFLLAGYFRNKNGVHFTVRHLLKPEKSSYDVKTDKHLEVSPMFFNQVIKRAEAENLAVVQCHSHPFAKDRVNYSLSDDGGEFASSRTLFDCLNGKPIGSLLFGQKKIIGRIWNGQNKTTEPIDQIRLIDRHMKLYDISDRFLKQQVADKEIYDRQIRAFGLKGQELLSKLKIGIVGVGGTGSSITEQLARQGVKRFLIIDHDNFEKSNRTRLYGSQANDKEDQLKVDIVKRNILNIDPTIDVQAIPKSVISQSVLGELKNCDIVFSCTDKQSPRSVLNELAHQHFIPVIDVGVSLNVVNQKIEAGVIGATLVSPTLPCLFCIGIINSAQITAESLKKQDRISRQKEGYIAGTGMDEDTPSVIEITTMAATLGLLLFKDLFFELVNTNANSIMFYVTTGDISRLNSTVKQDCTCVARFAKGDYVPLSAPP